jgi:hypothetical protein
MVKPSLYVELDPILEAWATQHGLHIVTRARDEAVRVASVVDDAGDTYQIWITSSHGSIAVDAALLRRAVGRTPSRDRDGFVFHEVVSRSQVRIALDAAFDQVRSWITQAGHSRTQR